MSPLWFFWSLLSLDPWGFSPSYWRNRNENDFKKKERNTQSEKKQNKTKKRWRNKYLSAQRLVAKFKSSRGARRVATRAQYPIGQLPKTSPPSTEKETKNENIWRVSFFFPPTETTYTTNYREWVYEMAGNACPPFPRVTSENQIKLKTFFGGDFLTLLFVPTTTATTTTSVKKEKEFHFLFQKWETDPNISRSGESRVRIAPMSLTTSSVLSFLFSLTLVLRTSVCVCVCVKLVIWRCACDAIDWMNMSLRLAANDSFSGRQGKTKDTSSFELETKQGKYQKRPSPRERERNK